VTDAGLKELAELKCLQILDLQLAKVTDVGLKELARVKSLNKLYLSYTRVTDSGLNELSELKKLKELTLSRPLVTDAGVSELQRALPACLIYLYDSNPAQSQPQVTNTNNVPLRPFGGRLFRRNR